MKNIMYFKLKIGEEMSPLRNMALANFPNADLHETDIQADNCGEKDILRHIIREINAGKYEKLYIKSLSDISRNGTEMIEFISGIATTNPGFEIELKGGFVVKAQEIMSRLNSAMSDVLTVIEINARMSAAENSEAKNHLTIKVESNGNQLLVGLPMEEDVLEDELLGADIKVGDNSNIKYTIDTSLPERFEKIIKKACEEKDIFAANEISHALLNYEKELDESLMAVIEYISADTTDKIMSVMHGVDGITFIEGAKSLEDVGRYWVTSDMESSVEREIDKYMDYTALGRDIMRDYEGKFVEGGCVLNRGEIDIEQLFKMNEDVEEGMGGIQGM